jgi:hypothetical protein
LTEETALREKETFPTETLKLVLQRGVAKDPAREAMKMKGAHKRKRRINKKMTTRWKMTKNEVVTALKNPATKVRTLNLTTRMMLIVHKKGMKKRLSK